MATARRPARGRAVAEARVPAAASGRLLLDTHVWLWWQKNDRRLGAQARRSITSAPDVYLSAASAWEIAIKASIGKLTLPRDANISAELALSGFLGLPVEVAHSEYVRQLPALHRDPFDRMLVAQARAEGLRIVTADPQLHAYGVPVLDARS